DCPKQSATAETKASRYRCRAGLDPAPTGQTRSAPRSRLGLLRVLGFPQVLTLLFPIRVQEVHSVSVRRLGLIPLLKVVVLDHSPSPTRKMRHTILGKIIPPVSVPIHKRQHLNRAGATLTGQLDLLSRHSLISVSDSLRARLLAGTLSSSLLSGITGTCRHAS